MAEQTFTATVASDMRGKIPTGLSNALGASPGDVIEFTVTKNGRNSSITHSTLLKGHKADQARLTNRNQSKTYSPKPKQETTPAKAVQKAKPAASPAKTVKKVVKTSPAPVKQVKKVVKTPAKPAPAPKKVTKVAMKKPLTATKTAVKKVVKR